MQEKVILKSFYRSELGQKKIVETDVTNFTADQVEALIEIQEKAGRVWQTRRITVDET